MNLPALKKTAHMINIASVDFFSHKLDRIYTLRLKPESTLKAPYLVHVVLAMLIKRSGHCYVFNNHGVIMKFILFIKKTAPP